VSPIPLPPLRFAPIFKSYLWGGRKLAKLPGAPADGPVAEAWVLSDVDGNLSRVADGPLQGTTLRELMRERRAELLGPALAHHDTFPLLLKYIDARLPLSVQVHPDDTTAQRLGDGPRGKTEAWVVVEAEPGSRIWAGLKPGVDRPALERALRAGVVEGCLHSFEPTTGDCVFLPAGTVHAIGGGLVVFEVQQASDITYRLHDWGRIDAATGRRRPLHVEQGLASTNFATGPVDPMTPTSESFDDAGNQSHNLVRCPFFVLCRRVITTEFLASFGECSILVCLDGQGVLRSPQGDQPIGQGDVYLLPACLTTMCVPNGPLTLLECWPQ
jgi:mannose-6-phosphate isomerase